MPRYDAHSSDVYVLTFKEGLLSAIAHDLKLRVGTFAIDLADDRSSVVATFDARSIRVECARVGGHDSPSTLGAKDKEKIEANLAADVLSVKKHPEIRFASSSIRVEGDAIVVRGTLTLAGKTKEIDVRAKKSGDRAEARVRLHQPDFGIKPYSAMLGTLKIQPDVEVSVSIPWA